MSESTRRAPARELLEAVHQFPCAYVIKAFGPAHDEFRLAIGEAARSAVGARVEIRERVSSRGNSICITMELHAEHVGEVIETYERLHDVPSLRLIL
jgi:putative lipoic acid-binding regulatory protein